MIELVTTKGTRYAPTAEDILWLARAVEVEGAPRLRVAQTLVNGFLWARDELGSKRTVGEWVRAYAQPVNPMWMPGGKMYEHELANAKTEAEREAVRAKGYRRQREHATRVRFSDATQKAVETALTAPPELPGAVDYAAPWIDKPEPWVAFTPTRQGENRFWARPGAVGWSGYAVDGTGVLPIAKAQGRWLPWVVGIGGMLLWLTIRGR